MKVGNGRRIVVTLAGMLGLAIAVSGCYGIPRGTMKEANVGPVKLQATGAGIVKADAKNVTFMIKCGFCGYENPPITIPTPTAVKPYTLDWVCPECGRKQKIVIAVAGQ